MSTPASLTASYASPTASQIFSSALPAVPNSDSVEAKTTFISVVRTNISQMQNDINAFLTQKMEEDKANEVAAAGVKNTEDEAREEEMYGEEDVGEE